MSRMFVFVLGTMLLFALSGCSQNPKLDVVPTVEGQQVVFDIPHSGINGILGFRVEDERGEPLWTISTSYEKGRKIVYGVLPTGGNMAARQVFPLENRPPAPVRGKTVTVSVDYQYDDMAACCSTYSKTIRIPE